MPACDERSEVRSSMVRHSQIANVLAIDEFRKSDNYGGPLLSHTANMDSPYDDSDKNGGPNHLREWMQFREVKGVDLAKMLGGNVTPGMVSDLMNSKRALSAKWLRRLAPALDTTPGMLLDHNPFDLNRDMIDIWATASNKQRKQLLDIAKALVGESDDPKTGTDGG